MSNLLTRTLSSVVFVALILGPLFLTDSRIAFTLYAVLGGLTLNEVLSLAQKSGTRAGKPLAFALYALLVWTAYSALYLVGNGIPLGLTAMGAVVLFTAVAEIFRTGERPFEQMATAVMAPAYVAASFIGIAYFFEYRSDLSALPLTVGVFALIWINDSGAYLIGRKLGRTKLFERLSPNKTWEGSLGGLVCSLAAGLGLAQLDGMPTAPVMLGFALTCVVFGSLGDLLESRMKRTAGVKDSGKFLPGHGGFFDRFDAMMLAIPAAILYFEIVLPKTY